MMSPFDLITRTLRAVMKMIQTVTTVLSLSLTYVLQRLQRVLLSLKLSFFGLFLRNDVFFLVLLKKIVNFAIFT